MRKKGEDDSVIAFSEHAERIFTQTYERCQALKREFGNDEAFLIKAMTRGWSVEQARLERRKVAEAVSR